jgi:hypothetical protein
MAVWRRARRDFTFKGESYRAGQVFAVSPLVAVQMRNRVDKAKPPQAEPEPEPPAQTRRRRTYTTKHMVADVPEVMTTATAAALAPAVEAPVALSVASELHTDDNGANDVDE